MSRSSQVDDFLAHYPERVKETAHAARDLLQSVLPDATESVDESAKVIGYGYGTGYKGLICTLIMSQSGVKLGIVRGAELRDPRHLMTGAGKIHRHVQVHGVADLKRPGLKQLLEDALAAWRTRCATDRRE
jgi:hypothetical protein